MTCLSFFHSTLTSVTRRFIGNNAFCFKWCADNGTNPDGKCQHTLDRIGMAYNCPSKYSLGSYTEGEYEYCDSDSFPVPGVYTDSAGTTYSYSQPAESLGPITSIPYTPRMPASSNCVKFDSAALFTDLAAATGAPSASGTGSGTGAAPTGTAKTSGGAAGTTGTRSGASTSPSATGAADGSNGAAAMRISAVATVAGVLAAVAFLA